MRQILPIAAVLVVCMLSAPLRSDDPVSSSVTFNREVIRIFERKCLPCHAPGAIAVSLATYREARPWARAIREELIEQRMPPWRAAPGYGAFGNDIGLTARELTMILTWTDGGAPRGDDRDLPPRAPDRNAARMQPDQRLELPAQHIPAGEEHVVRRVTIDAGAAADRWVRRIEIVPGNRRVMRAAFVSMVPQGARSAAQWIGGWTPWLPAIEPPEGAAFLLPAGARLVAELHYRGRDTGLEDRSSIAVFFAPDDRPVASQIVVETAPAPSTDRSLRRRGQSSLREDTIAWAVFPQLSAGPQTGPAGATSVEVTARKPDGTIQVLLWLPERRHDWPTPYILQAPVLLPAGTILTVTAAAPRGAGASEMLASSALTLSTYRRPPATE